MTDSFTPPVCAGNIYYLSSDGNDLADGMTPTTAWKTLQKANAAMLGGDTLRLRSGDTFYGRIYAKPGPTPSLPTTYETYGYGPKPEVSQYKIAKAEAWTEVTSHIWQINLADASSHTGNISENDTNIGFLKIDGNIFPHKVFKQEDLASQWDFYNDKQTHLAYIWSEKHPAELAQSIAFACNIHCLPMTANLAVRGIVFRGTGGHGMCSVGNHVTISDCEFHEIGGSELIGYPTPNTCYGNGVECWGGSSDILVENCKFSGIYDTATTMQGNTTVNWENIHFVNNVFWDCEQCFEVWADAKVPGVGFVNCSFENNVCLNSGYGWSYDIRPCKTNGSPLLIYGMKCDVCDIKVTGNVISNSHCAIICANLVTKPTGYKVFGNTIIRRPGQELIPQGKAPREYYEAYVARLLAENNVVDQFPYPAK